MRSVAAAHVAKLPGHHRDPFDRLLIAQAITEPAILYTADTQLEIHWELFTAFDAAVYIVRRFNQSLADVGLTFGFLVPFMGIVGPLIAGPLSDWLEQRFGSGRLFVTLAALLISPLLAKLVFTADSLVAFNLLFVPFSLAVTMWLPPLYATFLDLVLPRMRGRVISCYIRTMTVVGLGLAPFAVGLVSDITNDLGQSILNLYWLSPVIAAMVVLLILRVPDDEASLIARARRAGEA